MKKQYTLLILLLSTIFPVLAQDTITGVVNLIAAPYFEQNVCDTRFAITTENETYYVMVDNYWPNPYLEDLVIHYDTIAIGNEIEVVGEIKEIEDGNGEVFQTIDISKNLSSNYWEILGFYYPRDVVYPGPDTITAAYFSNCSATKGYYMTIEGELQPANSFVINGRTLVNGKRYLFIGITDTLINYNGNSLSVFELADALPYDVADVSINGTLTMENDLCLSPPCGESQYLALFDEEEYHYLTQKRKLKNSFINDVIFMEGDSVVVGGFEFVHHDLYGASFKTLEIVTLQSLEEQTLLGLVNGWGMPYINHGIPIPGSYLALIYERNGHYNGYYLMNPDNGTFFSDDYFIANNDTIDVTMQQLSVCFNPNMYVDNYFDPYYKISINQVDFNEHEEALQCTLIVAYNHLYFGNTLAVRTHNNEIYYLKPYIYNHTAPDYVIINNKRIHVGDDFTALGITSTWYDSDWNIHKVIDINSVEFETISESYSSKIQVFPNPSNGIIEIFSEQPIENISVYDCTGRVLVNKYCGFSQVSFDLNNYKGLAIIKIVFENGQIESRKVVIL